jgi:hypothetical protein
MTGRHRAVGEPEHNDPGRLLGALVAEPLEHRVAQAIADLTTSWLRDLPASGPGIHRWGRRPVHLYPVSPTAFSTPVKGPAAPPMRSRGSADLNERNHPMTEA